MPMAIKIGNKCNGQTQIDRNEKNRVFEHVEVKEPEK
jgi:hypothetical protein